jgi:hypothetical protein
LTAATAIGVVLAVALPTPVVGQTRPCTRDEAVQAEAQASSLRNWGDILTSFRKFGHCDDGAISEGYSVSVVAMLADRWNQLPELDNALTVEPTFRAFVLRHIDDTAGRTEFDRLVANVAVRCPPQSTPTCAAILERARELQP